MRRLAFLLLLAAACGDDPKATPDGGSTSDAGADAIGVDGATGPIRLTLDGTVFRDPAGQVVQLHGANLRDNLAGPDPDDPDGTNCITSCPVHTDTCKQDSVEILSPAAADMLATDLSLNFVRLRISFEGINRNDCDPDGTNLTKDLRDKLDATIALLAERHVWMLLEMRTSDEVANDAAFYKVATPSDDFLAYERAWKYLATRYANTDYIAGYGILAEPSPDRGQGISNDLVVETLVAFQRKLIDAVRAIDPRTPVFIGPAFNYDTMGYRWPEYASAFADLHGHIAYEVNILMPKPWIDDGTSNETDPIAYPQAATTDATLTQALLAPVDGMSRPLDDEQIFNVNRKKAAKFPLLLSPQFPHWYLATAAAFATTNQVPMVVDQFGASTVAEGQLDYERNVISVAEAYGMGWSRWLFSAYQGDQQQRDIEHNPDVIDAYRTLGRARSGP